MRSMLDDTSAYDSLKAWSADMRLTDVRLTRTEATMKAERDKEILDYWRASKNLSKTAAKFGISRHLAKQSIRRAARQTAGQPPSNRRRKTS